MKKTELKRKLTACLTLILLILFMGCGAPVVKFVPPPLDDPPPLDSMVPDNNDMSGEPGFWMNRGDAETERIFREGVRATKEKWK